MAEGYRWVAHLDDGSAYPEYFGGAARGWKSVPYARVISLELVPQRIDLPDLRIPITPGQTPVLFRRNRTDIDLGSGEQTRAPAITVIGWMDEDDAHYWAAYADGRVVETEDLTTIN